MAPRVDVGVVTWNTAELTSEALRRLLETDQKADLRVLVWDNASSDGTAPAVRAAAPQAEVIESAENIGFARAVNRLVERSDAPWFFALNSDAWPEAGAIGHLVDTATSHPRAAMVAPRLLRPDGTLEHSTHPFPTMGLAAIDALGLRAVLPRRWAEARCLEGSWAHDRLRQVDWAVGAAMLLRREALERVGGFDERFFLYNEDLDWCFRARALGLEIWFDPEAVVRHVGNVSGQRRFGMRKAALDERNLRVFLDEALGPRRAAVYHALQTAALARRYAGAVVAGSPTERAHWRGRLRASLGFVPPPVLGDPEAPQAEPAAGTAPAEGEGEDAPEVSVVVPTHNRAERLGRLLGALERQSLAAGSFEVVVVDDCSTDATGEVLASASASSTLRLTVLRTPANAGPATARNLGWRSARAPVVAFTDDDCVPDVRWLEAGLAALGGRARVVVGRTTAPSEQADLTARPFARAVEVDSASFFETCNVFYRRRDLDAVGGFDERFRRPSGEDTHLGLRVVELGVEPVFCEKALVYHDVRPGGALAALAEATRWVDLPLVVKGRAYARPGRALRRLFWKSSHPSAIVAGGGLAAARWWPPAALLGLPWLAYRLWRDPVAASFPRRVATLPAALALDLTEVATMVRGSIRHRTLLL